MHELNSTVENDEYVNILFAYRTQYNTRIILNVNSTEIQFIRKNISVPALLATTTALVAVEDDRHVTHALS